jgi:hypothetical protein
MGRALSVTKYGFEKHNSVLCPWHIKFVLLYDETVMSFHIKGKNILI